MATCQMDDNEKKVLVSEQEYLILATCVYERAKGYFMISKTVERDYGTKYLYQYFSIISFACELFMKSLLLRQKFGIKSMHDLTRLFSLLGEDVRNAIKDKHPCGNIPRDQFDKNLKHIGKAFTACRYDYEFMTLAWNGRFLQELVYALNEYCTSIFEESEFGVSHNE